MWYIKLLVTFMIGVTEIGCELCPENDGVKVVPVCTSGTVQGGAVAMSTEDLPSLPELNCSCTIISYVVGDEPLPVLYYYGPGYSPCGIEFDVGGYRFSCFQGFIHFNQTSTEVHFTKNLPSSYPEACLLLLAGGPSTELRISCRKPNMVNTPLSTSSSTRKPVTTKSSTLTSGTSPHFSSTSLTSKTSKGDSRNTTNLTTRPNLSVSSTDRTTLSPSKPISTFTNTVATPEISNVTETSLTTVASNTSFVTDMTKTGRSSDVTKTSAMKFSSVNNVTDTGRSSDVTKSSALKSSSFTNVTDSHETQSITKTSLVTDVVDPSTSRNVSNTSNTNPKTTLLKSDTTDTSVSTTASSLQSLVTTDTPSTEPSKISESSPMTLSNVSVTTIRHNSNLSETNGTTGVRSTNHFSSRSSVSETTSSPTLVTSTGNETGSTTIVVLLGKSRDKGDRTYVIVIAVCCGILATLLIAVFVFLYNMRSRRRNKSIPRREHVGTTYTYIDAFKGDTITLLNEPTYFTATTVETNRHNDQRFETSSAAGDISTTPFSDTVVTPTQTDIYAIVTRRPPVFLTQPMKKMVSFKGTGSDQGKETPSGDQRKPVSQYGILQRRESAKLERKISQTQRNRDGNRHARLQHDHFDIDMHAF